jgi:hypothetical protein
VERQGTQLEDAMNFGKTRFHLLKEVRVAMRRMQLIYSLYFNKFSSSLLGNIGGLLVILEVFGLL